MGDLLGINKHLAGLKRYVAYFFLPLDGPLGAKDQLVGVHISETKSHRVLGPLGEVNTYALGLSPEINLRHHQPRSRCAPLSHPPRWTDRVMLGSDYCFAIGYDRPVEVVTRLASLCRADQAKILGSNAARLLRLD